MTETDFGDLQQQWPEMPDLADGVDRFAQYPVTGAPIPRTVRDTLLAALTVYREEVGGSPAIDEARAWIESIKNESNKV